jgi:phage host-nuclease inhibitor protein Gam
MSDPQSRDIDWFTEWAGVEEKEDDAGPEIVGVEDAERRLWVVKMLDAETREVEAHYQNERERLDTWKEAELGKVGRQRSWLEKGLRAFLEGAEKKTMALVNGKLSLRKGREKVVIEDEDAFCLMYPEAVRTKVSPDKKAILAHIKDTGEIPEGCELVYGETSFTIRTGEGI